MNEEDARLLAALARFLDDDVRPALTDEGLAYRARIGAHLAAGLARGLPGRPERAALEAARLWPILGRPETPPLPGPALDAALHEANAELVGRLLTPGAVDVDAVRAHLIETLGAEIAVIQPRFDLRVVLDDLPEEP